MNISYIPVIFKFLTVTDIVSDNNNTFIMKTIELIQLILGYTSVICVTSCVDITLYINIHVCVL